MKLRGATEEIRIPRRDYGGISDVTDRERRECGECVGSMEFTDEVGTKSKFSCVG